MNLAYKPKDKQDKLNRLNNLISCYQKKDSNNKMVILEYSKDPTLFAIGINKGTYTEIKTDYHTFEVLNIYINGFFKGMKNANSIAIH